jgi:hypothetical protein
MTLPPFREKARANLFKGSVTSSPLFTAKAPPGQKSFCTSISSKAIYVKSEPKSTFMVNHSIAIVFGMKIVLCSILTKTSFSDDAHSIAAY